MGNEVSQEDSQGGGYGPGGPGGGGGGTGMGTFGGPRSSSGYGFGMTGAASGPGLSSTSMPMFGGGATGPSSAPMPFHGPGRGTQSLPPSAPASRRSSETSSSRSLGTSPVSHAPSAPPDVDLSHLSEEERSLIASVMARAQNMEKEADVVHPRPEQEAKRPTAQYPAKPMDQSGRKMCPMCQSNEIPPNINDCADCHTRVCRQCGAMVTSVTTRRMEWVCSSCAKKRQQQRQASSGMPTMGVSQHGRPMGTQNGNAGGRAMPMPQMGTGHPRTHMQQQQHQHGGRAAGNGKWGQDQHSSIHAPQEDGKLSEYHQTPLPISTSSEVKYVDHIVKPQTVATKESGITSTHQKPSHEQNGQAKIGNDYVDGKDSKPHYDSDEYSGEDDNDDDSEEHDDVEHDFLDERKEQKNKENQSKYEMDIERMQGDGHVPYDTDYSKSVSEQEVRSTVCREDLEEDDEEEDNEDDDNEEEEDDSEDDISPQILQPLPYYDHSPGEVYTIPEEEEEIQSPTGRDGVTSLSRWRGGVISICPDSMTTKPHLVGDSITNSCSAVSSSQNITQIESSPGNGTAEGRTRPFGVVRQQKSLEEVLGTAAKDSHGRTVDDQQALHGQRQRQGQVVDPHSSGSPQRRDVMRTVSSMGNSMTTAANGGRRIMESTSPDFASSGAGVAISNMITSATHQNPQQQQQGLHHQSMGSQQGTIVSVASTKAVTSAAGKTKPKSIDLQAQKKQKSKPDPQDWSPLTDLSPILDVSPSLEAAEQELMARFQEENHQERTVASMQSPHHMQQYPSGVVMQQPYYQQHQTLQPMAAPRTASGTISGMLADFSKALGLSGSSPRPSPMEERNEIQGAVVSSQVTSMPVVGGSHPVQATTGSHPMQQHISQQQQHVPQQQQHVPQQQQQQQQQPQTFAQQQQYPAVQQQQQYPLVQQQMSDQHFHQQNLPPQQQQLIHQQYATQQQQPPPPPQSYVQQQQQHQQQIQQQQPQQIQQQQQQPQFQQQHQLQQQLQHQQQQIQIQKQQMQQMQQQLQQQQQQFQKQQQIPSHVHQQSPLQQQLLQQQSPKKIHRRLPQPDSTEEQLMQEQQQALAQGAYLVSAGSPRTAIRGMMVSPAGTQIISETVTAIGHSATPQQSPSRRDRKLAQQVPLGSDIQQQQQHEATVLVSNGAIIKPTPAPRGLALPTTVDGTPTSVTAFSQAHVTAAAKAVAAVRDDGQHGGQETTPSRVLESPVASSNRFQMHGDVRLTGAGIISMDDLSKRAPGIMGAGMRGASPPRPSSPSIMLSGSQASGTPGSTPQTPGTPSQRGGDSSDTQSEADSVKSNKVRRKLPPLPANQEPSPLPSRKLKSRSLSAEEKSRLMYRAQQSSLDSASAFLKGTSTYMDISRPSSSASDNNLMGVDMDRLVGMLTGRSNLNPLKSMSASDLLHYDPSRHNYMQGSGLYGTSSSSALHTSKSHSDLQHYGHPLPVYLQSLKQQLRDELKSVTEERKKTLQHRELKNERLKRELIAAGLLPKEPSLLSHSPVRKSGTAVTRATPLSGQALYMTRSKLPSSRLTQPQPRKGHHRRQLSDSKIPAFSPIKEDKDFETEMAMKTPYKSFEYESIDDALRAEGLLGSTPATTPRPSTALGNFFDSSTSDYYHTRELRDTIIGASDYSGGHLRRTAGSSSDWYLSRASEGYLPGLDYMGRSSSQEGLYWDDSRHGRHYYISQQTPYGNTEMAGYRESDYKHSSDYKSRKPRSWHPSPYVSEDEDDQLTREEKKQKIKAEIARRRRQIEENTRLHDQLLRLAHAREVAAAKLQHEVNARASGLKSSISSTSSASHAHRQQQQQHQQHQRQMMAQPIQGSSSFDIPMSSYVSSYDLGSMDRRGYRQPPRTIDQSRSMPSISSQAEFREAGSVLKSIDEILQYDDYDKPAYQVYGDIFGKAQPRHGSGQQVHSYGHYPSDMPYSQGDQIRHEQEYGHSRHGDLRYSVPTEDQSIDRMTNAFGSEYNYNPAYYYGGYGDYSPLTTDMDTPTDFTPAMPLLPDMPSRSRKILEHLGSSPIMDSASGRSRPPLYRSRSEYDSRDQPYMTSAGDAMYSADPVPSTGSYTQSRHQSMPPTMSSSSAGSRTVHEPTFSTTKGSQQYDFPTKRILLSRDAKDRSISGSGLGMKVVGGKAIPGSNGTVGAYVAKIYPGGVVDTLSEVKEGDQILEWNGEALTGKTYEEVQKIVCQSNGEIEIVIRSDINMANGATPKSPAPAKPPRKNHPNNAASGTAISNATGMSKSPRKNTNHNNNPQMSAITLSNHLNNNVMVSGCTGISDDQYIQQTRIQRHMDHSRGRERSRRQGPDSNNSETLYETRQRKQQSFPMKATQLNDEQCVSSRSSYINCDGIDKQRLHETSNYLANTTQHPNNSPYRDLSLSLNCDPSAHGTISSPQSPSLSPSLPTPQSFSSLSPKHERYPTFVKGNNGRRQKFKGEVQVQVCYDIKAQILYVTILAARNLISTNDKDDSRPDPFVKCYLLPGRSVENQRRTRYFSRSSSPVWKQTMVYPNVAPTELQNKYLEITVWNYDIYKPNEFLGEVILNLSDENIFDEEPRWYHLHEHRDSQHRSSVDKGKQPSTAKTIQTHSSDTSLSSMTAATNSSSSRKGPRSAHYSTTSNRMFTSQSNDDFHKVNPGEHKTKKFGDAQGSERTLSAKPYPHLSYHQCNGTPPNAAGLPRSSMYYPVDHNVTVAGDLSKSTDDLHIPAGDKRRLLEQSKQSIV